MEWKLDPWYVSPDWCSGHLGVPLFATVQHDSITWFPSKDGLYSVKIAYHIFLQKLVDSHQHYVEGDWGMIWKLEIPLCVRNFIWRACRDCLPVLWCLQMKEVQCSATCVIWDIDLENCWHLLITCSLSRECWKNSGFWSCFEPWLDKAGGFSELFFGVWGKSWAKSSCPFLHDFVRPMVQPK